MIQNKIFAVLLQQHHFSIEFCSYFSHNTSQIYKEFLSRTQITKANKKTRRVRALLFGDEE